MPRRRDIESICLIGSGPIVIGQACEFDYSGCQALKVLREDGFRTIVVNSNPATIMTDPGFADRTYIEPLDFEGVADVLRRERPDALLPTMGGQTALNLAVELAESGTLADLGVELIGAPIDVIRRAEDRERFRETVQLAGLRVPESTIVTSPSELPDSLTFPVILRPAFTLGGHGGGTARSPEELEKLLDRALRESPVGQVLVEESLLGWDEFELEVMRDRNDNAVIVCSIENLDPMGVHTGDSVTVAPQMTLSDEAYQELRDATLAVVRAVGVETRRREHPVRARARDRRAARDRDEPARVALLGARVEGDRLSDRQGRREARGRLHAGRDPERPHRHDACQLRADPRLRRRQVPALRLREVPRRGPDTGHPDEVGRRGDGHRPHLRRGLHEGHALARARRREPRHRGPRSTRCRTACTRGSRPSSIASPARWPGSRASMTSSQTTGSVSSALGISDADVAERCGVTQEVVRGQRRAWGVQPVYRRVDSCAGEVEAASNYFYSTWGEAEEARSQGGQAASRDPRLRPEPHRPGDRVRLLLRPRGAVVPRPRLRGRDGQLQPGDGLDRLRHVRPALLRAARRRGSARDLRAGASRRRRHPVRGSDPAQARACARRRGFPHPRARRSRPSIWPRTGSASAPCATSSTWPFLRGRWPREPSMATYVAEAIGYPVLIRPSYVLGGRNMQVCYEPEAVAQAAASGERVLVDRFLEGAVEIDVDALCDGKETYVAAVMQHIEEAGVHSGDSSCVLPAPSLSRADGGGDRGDGAPARTRARRGRPRQRPARAGRRRALRPGGEPARLAHGAVRQQGDRRQPRRSGLPARGGHAAGRAGPAPGTVPGTILCQGCGLAVRALPRGRPRARARDALDGRGHGERGRPADRPGQGRARSGPAAAERRDRVPLRSRRRQAGGDRDRPVAVAPRLPPRRHGRDRAHAGGGRHRRRARPQGDRGGGRRDRGRPRPPRPLRARREHALRRLRRPLGRLSDPRGRAHRARPVHHDDCRGARAAVRAIAEAQGDLAVSLQERISAQPRSA